MNVTFHTSMFWRVELSDVQDANAGAASGWGKLQG